MKKGLILLFCLITIGCGTSDNSTQGQCDVMIDEITNGPSLELIESRWVCFGSTGEVAALGLFGLFDNGLGATIVINSEGVETYGEFSWDEIACGEILVTGFAASGFSESRLSNIVGSRTEGALSFTFFSEGDQVLVSCSLSN